MVGFAICGWVGAVGFCLLRVVICGCSMGASGGCDSASSFISGIGCFRGFGGGSRINGLGDGGLGRVACWTVVWRWVMESSCAIEVTCFVIGDFESDERADKGSN